jgi:hypothetical protein
MALDTTIKRCEKDDPNRCQAKNARGDQCMNEALRIGDGFAKYCSIHGGVMEHQKKEKESLNMYRLAKYGERVKELKDHGEIKGLRSEIGILRMVLEQRLNQCQDDQELMLSSNVIGDLVAKIEKLVTSCHKLEASMGQLLDRQQILQFAEVIITIIGNNVSDAALLEKIANEISEATETQLSGNEAAHAEKKSNQHMTVGLDG